MNDKHDDEFHDDHLSNLYRQSRIDEPPMALDSTILAQARKAVAKPEKKRVWDRFGWKMPLASVAIAMLTVSLIIQTKQEHPEVMMPEVMMDTAPVQEQGHATQEDEMPLPTKQAVEEKALSEPAASHQPASPTPVEAAQPAKAKSTLKKEAMPAARERFRSAPAQFDSGNQGAGLSIEETNKTDAVRSRSKTDSEDLVDVQIGDWLKHIRELIQQGEMAEAKESLKAFRIACPRCPLPEDITAALEK
ncbi:hypothetical protein F3F96_05425 [Mariprofundus sp. NF]|uniref:hypothetical protein n=1 Tax=Mariprofundus sp. NF TaxID=2608716 RepID=UPI0015A34BA4|nr:hypothetical protein [Mariprofundus sp. NF]NWF38567.1 hypothetical protein [Mariprofundus sp. NF]